MSYPLIISILLLVGLVGGTIASKSKLPTVTGYILFGLLLGPSFLHIITSEIYASLSFVNDLALGMLAVSIGAELHRQMFRRFGKNLTIISVGNVLLSASLVTVVTWLFGMPFQYALILGVVSTTVSPSGVVEVLKEKKAKGEFTQNLLGLVAVDNLICILLFGVVVSLVQSTGGTDASGSLLLLGALGDIVLGVVLGAATGTVFSYFVQRDIGNDRLLALLLAAILLNTGLANNLGHSPILVNIVTGIALTNLTSRRTLLTTLLDRIELPVFVVFLTLAGAKLDLAIIGTVGLVGLGYILARAAGRYFGALLFSQFTTVSAKVKKNIGFGLFPQAGIAIGLATIAEKNLVGAAGIITGVVLTGVIFFEIFGPLFLGKAVDNVGEANN